MRTAPTSDIDLYSTDALDDPYPRYAELRAQGAAVWMSRLNLFALPRYSQVLDALMDWETYSSARGVMVSDEMNDLVAGRMMLCTDPPEHAVFRRIARRPLLPKALLALVPRIREEAERIVERAVAKGSFDAMTELAQPLPVSIVSKLVGVPEHGRERMLEWANGSFNAMGPMNERARAGMRLQEEMLEYAHSQARPPHLAPDGWAQMLFDAGARGEIAEELCPVMIPDYLAPSLDTTIHAIGNATMLFATHPEQWDAVRADPSLIGNAINEVLRLESPVQRFTRHVTRDIELDGIAVPAGSRVMVMYASANRDPEQWPDPDVFDVRRPSVEEHMAFGFGEHACIGQHLARIEIRSLLEALASRVVRFDITNAVRNPNQTLRGFNRLDVTLTTG